MRIIKGSRVNVLVIILIIFWVNPSLGAETAEPQEQAIFIPDRIIEVYLDGRKSSLNYTAFIDTTDRAVISLNDCGVIFAVQIEAIDNRLVLRKGIQEFMLDEGDYRQLASGQGLEENSTNLQLDEIYLPMRLVAEQLGYKIDYNSRAKAVIIRSPDYQGPDPLFPKLPELPANIPKWGTLADVPVMAELWPAENIVAGYFTSIATSPAPRNYNILLSCNKLNGVIINPGEVGSFNRIVGRRTVNTGYKIATVIEGDRFVPGLGGGVCQTSSTLYNSLLESQLQIIERHPHTLPISYVPANRDATVSWGGADLKFRNNKSYPIKILSQIYCNYVIFAIAAVE